MDGAQGDPSHHVYIVESGEYTMHLKQAGDKPLERYRAGAIFGELALLYNTPQQATVKCKAAGALWKLDRRVFQYMTSKASKSKTSLTIAAIRQSPLLGGLTDEQLELVASAFETMDCDGGEVVGVEGKLAEAFYVIQQGQVSSL